MSLTGPDQALVDGVMDRLGCALRAGDADAVARLLHGDVDLIVDRGGRDPDSIGALSGSAPVASALTALAGPEAEPIQASINGEPGLVLVSEGRVVGAVAGEVRGGVLTTVWVVCDPEKLRHWNRG